ncbi:hypothetical protein DPMN_127100 [Dreissena polymorpha]|uniref:Uncharacterized protein n=1 Tax=Dreissena polymorpha TaxID=45954 RepID=A0A9D4GX24_DREPO|nr:hypothetical protein DPMN_127100 [Dreissena polymorpha]
MFIPMLQRERRRCFPGANEGVELPHHASLQIVPNSVCAERYDVSPEDLDVSPEDHDVSQEDHDVSPEDHDVSPEDHDVSPEDYDVSPEDTPLIYAAGEGRDSCQVGFNIVNVH